MKIMASLVMLLAAILLLSSGSTLSDAAGTRPPSARQCKSERKQMVNACKPLLYGNPPSASCCLSIRVTHLQCVCPVITPKLAATIDVKRAVRIVQGCGRRLPRHFKCGSVTTP